ncbi:MAG: hypothetical protein AB7S40_04400 [Bacteroidales bacterium]
MKKVIFFLMVLTGVVFAINKAMSMTEAIIDVPTCLSCGACWSNNGEPYFPHEDGTAYWGDFQTGESMGLRFYSYPSYDHIPWIALGKADCPGNCIITW